MAACRSLQHIFDKPLPENPTLFQSLSSWQNQMNPLVEQSSFTEIFGELHFEDINVSSYIGFNEHPTTNEKVDNEKESSLLKGTKIGESFLRMNYGSLQLCTEGLGFESTDDVDVDFKEKDMPLPLISKGRNQIEANEEEKTRQSSTWANRNGRVLSEVGELRKSRLSWGGGGRGFPPPISCIGKSGKPWVCFKSFREEGRFVLTEVRIPTQEFLQASREDGRLKLKFVQPEDDEKSEEEDEEDDNLEDEEEEGTASSLEEDEQEKKSSSTR